MVKYPLNRQSLDDLVSKAAAWLKNDRAKGMEQLESLPFPVRTEETWRRINPKLFSLEGKIVVSPAR